VNPIELCNEREHGAGWSVGDVRIVTSTGWLVSGSNEANRLDMRGATQSEVWSQAVAQVRALGMLELWVSLFA
jgi:hypothetical protein